jgi:hypothetical protein
MLTIVEIVAAKSSGGPEETSEQTGIGWADLKVGGTDSEVLLPSLTSLGQTSWSGISMLICSTDCSSGLVILRSDSNKAAGLSDVSVSLAGPLANTASRSSLILSVSEISSATSDLDGSEI